MKQKHSLSQVFLTDKKYIQRILSALDIEDEVVLEIGPGLGNISKYLSLKAKSLLCVEIDQRFCKLLEAKFSDQDNVEIIHKDILQFTIPKSDKGLIVFGNVPYQISSSLIDYLIKYRSNIKRAYLTLQKEFSDKLLARQSTPEYGVISCRLQYYAKPKKLFDIPAASFSPKPKVDSSFIEIEFFSKPQFPAEDEDFLFHTIAKVFSQRRKKAINSLPPEAKEIFAQLAIDPNLRPADLSLRQYVLLANCLNQK